MHGADQLINNSNKRRRMAAVELTWKNMQIVVETMYVVLPFRLPLDGLQLALQPTTKLLGTT